jgi:UDP-glucose 4-epimerase
VNARRALVTGGGGFIGSHLVDALLEQGWSVCVLDDFTTGREENLTGSLDRIDLMRGDVRDAETVARAVDGAEVVFHQAALPSVPISVREPLRTHAVNLGGTLEVLEGARRAGVRRVVYAASSSAYGDAPDLPKQESMRPSPCSPYALQKYAGEVYCRLYTELYGLETVALRYFNVYGPRQDPQSDYAAVIPLFVSACLEGVRPHIHGSGNQTRDFVFVSDVARANLLAAASGKASGGVVNVAGGRSISILGLWTAIRDVAGSDLEPVHDPGRPGDVRDSLADLTRAAELLGFEPTIDLEEGLRRTLQASASPQRRGESS